MIAFLIVAIVLFVVTVAFGWLLYNISKENSPSALGAAFFCFSVCIFSAIIGGSSLAFYLVYK